jgi:uroporphyrinogen-III synthase
LVYKKLAEKMSNLKVKTILVSQPEPKVENSPYFELQQKHESKS